MRDPSDKLAASSTASASTLLVRRLDRLSNEQEQVLRLYRANSGTLGFLPRGAFQEFEEEGCVLVAVADSQVVGYLAYRIAGNSARVVHLCVDSERRRSGVARGLAEELFRETAELEDVRLFCREDYPLTTFWPRLGFICGAEKPGRGKDGKKLFLWVRRNPGHPSLLTVLDAARRANRRTVAIDANVFYDLDGTDERSQESQSLLADWLADDVAICVTAEIKNEITRNPDADIRARRRRQIDDLKTLEATGDRLETALSLIVSLLPLSKNPADESDRRQLAHAVAERADAFVTRDETLLAHAEIVRAHTNIEILRPTDFLVQLHSQTNERYAPARLLGTPVVESPVQAERDLAGFQRFSLSETKPQWLQRLRPVLSEPHRFETTLVSWDGAPRAVYALERAPAGINIVLLRAQRDRRAPTVLRRILAEVLTRAHASSAAIVRCGDLGDPAIESALVDVGFVLRSGQYEKCTMRAVVGTTDLPRVLPEAELVDASLGALERTCWPLKIQDIEAASFVVPIRPHWAAQLFDSELATRDLFGAHLETALALENIYYSSSSVNIPDGARILWYVSGRVQAIRAASISLGTVSGTAKELFRRFARLGIYRWNDLMRRSNGDPNKPLLAYRFAYTERFAQPVTWANFQAVLQQRTGHGNPVAGPTRISEQVYFDVYRVATRL